MQSKGFSLTELSLSLAIIAMIAGSAISVAINNTDYAKVKVTNDKLDRIEDALAAFVALNDRLPCPADGTLLTTDGDFGTEGTRSDTSCPEANFTSGNVRGGVVPVTTLSLPDDYMFDGWGRRISYAVDYQFASNVSNNSDCDGTISTICFVETVGSSASITVNDAGGSNRTTTAVYVVFSHGQNGHGAFIKNGSSTRINAYTSGNAWRTSFDDELENAHYTNAGADDTYDTVFVAKQFLRDENNDSDYFDDLLRFAEKSEIVRIAGGDASIKIIYDDLCVDAAAIVASPPDVCSGADSESDCEDFATEVNSRCL